MNYVAMVKILHCSTGLDDVPPDLRHGKIFSFSNDICQRAVFAYFEDDISILFKGKGTIEFDDVRMVKLGMELQLGNKLRRIRNLSTKEKF
jgi:hypothetical protein